MKRLPPRIAAVVLLPWALACPASAAQTHWQGATGNWSEGSNWTVGEPGLSDHAHLGNGGTAELSEENERCADLLIGGEVGESGTVDMSAGDLSATDEHIGHVGTGVFIQAGGKNAISENLFIGCLSGSEGSYELRGAGQLSARWEDVGYAGTGTFAQTGGTNRTGTLRLACAVHSNGTYHLGGTAELSATRQYIGYQATGRFHQTGGTNAVSRSLYVGYLSGSRGTYELGGAARLSAGEEYIGHDGAGTLMQNGGSNTTGYLSIGTAGRYLLGGGSLEVTDSGKVLGVLDFAAGSASADLGGLVDLAAATLTGSGSATVVVHADSLLIVPAGFDPAAEFGTFVNHGLVHQSGATLVVAAGEGFSGNGTVASHVECQGTISAATRIDLTGGLAVSGSGSVDLGEGNLTVENGLSGISGGELAAKYQRIGDENVGTFTHSGGTNTASFLLLGDKPGSHGTYELGGSGELSAAGETIGCEGAGTFTHTAGTNTVGSLSLADKSGSQGTYELTGGQLSAREEEIGCQGQGAFTQTGGTNTTGYLSIGELGSYALREGTLEVTDSARVLGTLDFAGGNSPATMTGLINLGHATLTGTGSATLEIGPDSLLIVPAGFDPAAEFGTFVNHGLLHQSGSTLSVERGQGFSGRGIIEDHVECQGSIKAAPDRACVSLLDGLRVSGSGRVDLSALKVDDHLSGISGGELSASRHQVGHEGNGTFRQSGGKSDVSTLMLGQGADAQGTYVLSGTAELSASWEYHGYQGEGVFVQSGGTHVIRDSLCLGREPGSNGTYDFSGGTLIAEAVARGEGTAEFNWSGGTLHVETFGSSERPFDLANSGQGTLAPGSPIGSTELFGSYSQGPEATLAVELDASGTDEVTVTGNANLDGSLVLKALGSLPTVGDHEGLRFLRAAGRSGRFRSFPPDGAHLGCGVFMGSKTHPGVSYDDRGVSLSLFQAAAGDRDGNREVDFGDIWGILSAGKYNQGPGDDVDWTVGDFDTDGQVDSDDVWLIVQSGLYERGTYAATTPGWPGDNEVGIFYDPANGDVFVDTDSRQDITGIKLLSASGIFVGPDEPHFHPAAMFTRATPYEVSSAAFGAFLVGDRDYGRIAAPGLHWDFLLEDLTLYYTIAGAPGNQEARLLWIPEPGTLAMLPTGGLVLLLLGRARRRRRPAG